MEVTEAEITRPIPPGGSLAEQFPSASPPPLFRREPPARVIKTSRRRLCIIFEPGKQGPERNVPRKTAWNERPKNPSFLLWGRSPRSRRRREPNPNEDRASAVSRNLPEVILIRRTSFNRSRAFSAESN